MNRQVFFDRVRAAMFGGRLSVKQVDSMDVILDHAIEYPISDVRQAAYILGTAFHESDRFNTTREYASGAAYEGRKDLGNTQAGDGVRFRGRGFVQITGRRNYTDWAQRLGIDIVAKPERAEEPEIAARIIVEGMAKGTFTNKKLADYISDTKADYVNARRIVNGTDKAALIAGYAETFEAALKAAEYGAQAPAPVPSADDPRQLISEIRALLMRLQKVI